jgi:hypothetical protein
MARDPRAQEEGLSATTAAVTQERPRRLPGTGDVDVLALELHSGVNDHGVCLGKATASTARPNQSVCCTPAGGPLTKWCLDYGSVWDGFGPAAHGWLAAVRLHGRLVPAWTTPHLKMARDRPTVGERGATVQVPASLSVDAG